MKCPFPLTNREYIDYNVLIKKNDKHWTLINFHCPNILYPVTKKYVRGYNEYMVMDLIVINEDTILFKSTGKSNP